jgi:hypothetical protein
MALIIRINHKHGKKVISFASDLNKNIIVLPGSIITSN